MAFTFGFYNSSNHDRRYDAIQVSQLFDGLINDGIYATIGECMIVRENPDANNSVIIGWGRGWFDHTWNYLDSDLAIIMNESDYLTDRYDAIVIDIDENTRTNQLTVVYGAPSNNPVKPTLIKTSDHHQYPLCYIYRHANTAQIRTADIENRIGTSDCPFVTGIIKTINTDALLAQWTAEWKDKVTNYRDQTIKWSDDLKKDLEKYYAEFQLQLTQYKNDTNKDLTDWSEEMKAKLLKFFNDFTKMVNDDHEQIIHDLMEWVERIDTILDENAEIHIINMIDDLTKQQFDRYYGLLNTTTVINEQTNVITQTSDEAASTTTFSTEGNKDIITVKIEPVKGKFNYIKTVIITPTTTGSKIDTTYQEVIKEVN